MCEHCTRRQFFGMGAASGLMLATASSWNFSWAAAAPRVGPRGKARIGVLFTGEPAPSDRDWGADGGQVAAMRTRLAEAEKSLGNIELVLGESRSTAETEAFLQQTGAGTPVLAINVRNFALTGVVQPILRADRPMAVYSHPASGHDWMYAPRWREAGHRVALLASSDYDELERALRVLRVVPMMQQSRILLFPPARGTRAACSADLVKERVGADVVAVDEGMMDDLVRSVEDTAVEAEMASWTRGARAIVEPTHDDIEKAARVSVALNRLIEQEQADGLAIGTCMGWLPRGFPCLGFARLHDRGVPAACEGDMDSLLTMLMFRYAFDQPGFQGNATFDTARNALWTAHCTAPLKMDGADGEEAPYLLRGHSEVGGSGCVPEVQYRLGQVITRTKMVNLDTILLSTGEIIEVPERSVHGCRTQIVTAVKDASKMAANWSKDIDTEDAMTLLHRVVYYGDHVESVRHLANLMDMRVVEEG